MDDLELRASRSNVCKVVEDISVIHITYEEIQPSTYEKQPVENVDNFQRNARWGHLVFQNEANFSPSEAYPPMKISWKFGEPSWCHFPLRVLRTKISLRVAAA